MSTTITNTPATTRPRLLTLDELCEYIGVAKGTVLHWRVEGRGPRGLKVGRFLRFRPEDVEIWLDAQADAKAS